MGNENVFEQSIGYFPHGGNSPGAMGGRITPIRKSAEGIFRGDAEKVIASTGVNPFVGATPRGSTSILEFPLDVASGDAALGNHGHYIMFYINEQDKAQLTMSPRGEGGSQADNLAKPYGIPSFVRQYSALSQGYQKQRSNGVKKGLNADVVDILPDMSQGELSQVQENRVQQNLRKSEASGGSTVRVTRKPTKRLATSIAMYMPQSVQVTYGAQYQDTQIGAVTESALNTFNEFVSGRLSGGLEELKKVGADTADQLQLFLLGAVGIIPGLGGVREVSEMKSGNVIADRLELAFKGINKRNFQYTFKMTPKDRREVEMIRKIIFAFKSNMMPEFIGGNRGGRRLLVPNTFDIAYMYTGNQNLHLHNISTCVLENMNVTYGGDRYRTFEADGEGAQPVETTMTLNFKEMELITRERIFEGY